MSDDTLLSEGYDGSGRHGDGAVPAAPDERAFDGAVTDPGLGPLGSDEPDGDAVETAGQSDEAARVAAERDEYLEALQRLEAEFDNYRKRGRREQERVADQAAATVIDRLLRPAMVRVGAVAGDEERR